MERAWFLKQLEEVAEDMTELPFGSVQSENLRRVIRRLAGCSAPLPHLGGSSLYTPAQVAALRRLRRLAGQLGQGEALDGLRKALYGILAEFSDLP